MAIFIFKVLNVGNIRKFCHRDHEKGMANTYNHRRLKSSRVTRHAKRGEAFSARQSTTFQQPREPIHSTNCPLTHSTNLSLFFSLRSPISATIVFYFQPPNSDNSVRKFSFGSQPVSHLKQPTNTPTYDFTLYFPSFLFYHPTAAPYAIFSLPLSLFPFLSFLFSPLPG